MPSKKRTSRLDPPTSSSKPKVLRFFPILRLPPELLPFIAAHLDYIDATCASLTCRALYHDFSRPPIPSYYSLSKRLSHHSEAHDGKTIEAIREGLLQLLHDTESSMRDIKRYRRPLLSKFAQRWMPGHIVRKGESYCASCVRFHVPRPPRKWRPELLCERCGKDVDHMVTAVGLQILRYSDLVDKLRLRWADEAGMRRRFGLGAAPRPVGAEVEAV